MQKQERPKKHFREKDYSRLQSKEMRKGLSMKAKETGQ